MSERTDSRGDRIPDGWDRDEWERLTSQQRSFYLAGGYGGGFGMTTDPGDER
jgi:hypothetical protein